MAKTPTPNRPAYRIYAVRKTGTDKSQWTQIGAARPNADGRGFNLKLHLVPTDNADIVMREPKDEGDAQ